MLVDNNSYTSGTQRNEMKVYLLVYMVFSDKTEGLILTIAEDH